MSRTLKRGDHVSWNSEAGRVRDTVMRKVVSDVKFKGYNHYATRAEPQYFIKSDKTDHVAIHKGSTNGSFYLTWDLKPEDMLPWAAAIYKQREADFRRETDGIACLPPGPKAAIGVGPFPIKIVQTPGLVVILHEYDTIFRQIFTDGRALPEDANPTWMGYSIGRWEGNTLVVTTAGYNDRSTIDLAGHPHTEALRMTERFHRRDVGHLDVQITFDDPKAYTRPWTLPMEFALVPDGDLIEYVCENERDARHLVGKSTDHF